MISPRRGAGSRARTAAGRPAACRRRAPPGPARWSRRRSRRAQATGPQRGDRPRSRSRTPPWPSCPPTAASLTPVINATGVLVHTNLGRAPLSAAAVAALQAAAGNCDVEFDLEHGRALAARPRRRSRRPARGGPRRPGGRRGEQQRGRARAGRHGAGRGQGDRHQPRRADRDRRPVPAARPADGHRRAAARGRHHQPDDRRATTSRRSARTPASSSRSTRPTTGSRGSPGVAGQRTRRARRPRSCTTSARACSRRTRCCLASRTRPRPSPTARTWSPPAATSCSAARRPACCSATPTWSAACCGTRSPARCGSTS